MQKVDKAIKLILTEDARRTKANKSPFNPITGEGSVGERKKVVIEDYPIEV